MKVHDCYGNNCAVTCSECGQVFLVSAFLGDGSRTCPRCGRWRIPFQDAKTAFENDPARAIIDAERGATRLTFRRDWLGHDVWVTFSEGQTTYRYPHDQLLQTVISHLGIIKGTKSWELNGLYNFPRLSVNLKRHLERYRVQGPGNN